MYTQARSLLVAALVVAATPTAARAQQASCLPEDDFSISLLAYAQNLATSTDSTFAETRTRYSILPVPLTEVERITDNATCKKAAREYKKAISLKGKAPKVHVIRIGMTFIVMNPDTRGGEFTANVVFDDQFNALAAFGG